MFDGLNIEVRAVIAHSWYYVITITTYVIHCRISNHYLAV
jgi:hypothetical protein